MKTMRSIRKAATIGGVGLLCLPIMHFYLCTYLPTWNCRRTDINIQTGKARDSRYIGFVRTSVNVYDTSLSLALTGGAVVATTGRAWWPVNTFSPPSKRYSPHHFLHGALHQTLEADMIFRDLDASPDRRAAIAREILTVWQTTTNYLPAEDVLSRRYRTIDNRQLEPPGGGSGVPSPHP